MSQQDVDRNEEATPFKLDDARQRGSVAKSVDLISFVVLSTATVGLFSLVTPALNEMAHLLAGGLGNSWRAINLPNEINSLLADSLLMGLTILAPLLLFLVVSVVVVNLIYSGPVFSAVPLKPDLTRLNPIAGFKKLLSLKVVFEAIKSVLKIAAISVVAYLAIKSILPGAGQLFGVSVKGFLVTLVENGAGLAAKLCAVLALFALIDLIYSHWDFKRTLRMSQREIHDEVKHREGDPRIKARLRELRLEFLQRTRAVAKVPEADVLIINPTHLAVALRYEHGTSPAPKLLAKGAGTMARQMRDLASKAGVPIVQNPPLARALFKEVEQDSYIPEKWYPQVAKILVWVQNARRTRDAARGGRCL